MMCKHVVSRALWIGACGAAVLLSATATGRAAPADDLDSRACESTYQSARKHQLSGQLVEASKLFEKCADIACNETLWLECATKERQVHSQLSSVVPVVTDDTGEPLTDVKVSIDGTPLTSTLDGRSLTVIPGAHVFSFSMSDAIFASEKVTLAKGEYNRLISVLLPSGGSLGPVSFSRD